ncbi:MAG TPA: hypothetical protein VK698_02240 [Kofleriaceae bacterium]|nr:hypothetical protein [Kofleriaceae bacterium]
MSSSRFYCSLGGEGGRDVVAADRDLLLAADRLGQVLDLDHAAAGQRGRDAQAGLELADVDGHS